MRIYAILWSILFANGALGEAYQYYPAEVLGQGLSNMGSISPEVSLFTNPSLPSTREPTLMVQGQGLSQLASMMRGYQKIKKAKDPVQASSELSANFNTPLCGGQAILGSVGLAEPWRMGIEQYTWVQSDLDGDIIPILNGALKAGIEGVIAYREEGCRFCPEPLPDLSWGVSLRPSYVSEFVVDQKDGIQIYEDPTLINPRYRMREALGIGFNAALTYGLNVRQETLKISTLLKSTGPRVATGFVRVYAKPEAPDPSHLWITTGTYEFQINPFLRSAVSYGAHLGGGDLHHLGGKLTWEKGVSLVGGWSQSERDWGLLASYEQFRASLLQRTFLAGSDKASQSLWLGELGYSF